MKKKHNGTQIVAKLRQADVLIGQGKTVPEVCKEIDVSEQTYYRPHSSLGYMTPAGFAELCRQAGCLRPPTPALSGVHDCGILS